MATEGASQPSGESSRTHRTDPTHPLCAKPSVRSSLQALEFVVGSPSAGLVGLSVPVLVGTSWRYGVAGALRSYGINVQ